MKSLKVKIFLCVRYFYNIHTYQIWCGIKDLILTWLWWQTSSYFICISTYICILGHFSEGIYHNHALYVASLHRIWYKWTFNKPTLLGAEFGISKSFPVFKTEKTTFSEDGGGRWGRNWFSWRESNLYYICMQMKVKKRATQRLEPQNRSI